VRRLAAGRLLPVKVRAVLDLAVEMT